MPGSPASPSGLAVPLFQVCCQDQLSRSSWAPPHLAGCCRPAGGAGGRWRRAVRGPHLQLLCRHGRHRVHRWGGGAGGHGEGAAGPGEPGWGGRLSVEPVCPARRCTAARHPGACGRNKYRAGWTAAECRATSGYSRVSGHAGSHTPLDSAAPPTHAWLPAPPCAGAGGGAAGCGARGHPRQAASESCLPASPAEAPLERVPSSPAATGAPAQLCFQSALCKACGMANPWTHGPQTAQLRPVTCCACRPPLQWCWSLRGWQTCTAGRGASSAAPAGCCSPSTRPQSSQRRLRGAPRKTAAATGVPTRRRRAQALPRAVLLAEGWWSGWSSWFLQRWLPALSRSSTD